jgi:hypothetical protein
VGSDGLGFAAAPQQQQQQQEEQQQGQQDPSGSGPGVAARASNTLAGSRSGGREAGSSGAPEGDALGGGGVAGGRLGVGLELSGSQGVSDSEGEDEDEGTLPQVREAEAMGRDCCQARSPRQQAPGRLALTCGPHDPACTAAR